MLPSPGGIAVSSPRATGALVVALSCVAGLLGALNLGRHSLWLDESATAQLARLPSAAYWHLVTGREANSVVYFTLVRGVGAGFGYGEASVRALSVVATALTVPAIFAVAAELFDRRSGLFAALLFSVSPAAVAGAQEARGFALESLLLTCSAFALLRAVRGRRGWWVVWVATSVVAVYVHLLAVLVPVALGAATAAWMRSRATTIAVTTGLVAVITCTAPLVYLGHRGGEGGLLFLRGATARNLRALPLQLAAGSWPVAVLLAAAAATAAIGLAKALTVRGVGAATYSTSFTFIWLIVPVLLAAAISVVKPVFSQRYFLFALVPLLVLAASVLRRLPRLPQFAATATLGIFGILGISHVYTRPPVQDWRGATQVVLEHAAPGDASVILPVYYRGPVEYYRERAPKRLRRRAPAPAMPPVPWGYRVFDTSTTTGPARKVLKAASRVWVLRGPPISQTPSPRSIQRRFRALRQFQFHGVDVILYVAKGAK